MNYLQPSSQSRRNKYLATLAVGFFIVTGTYNAVVINSESHISGADINFVKRLDEVYGVVQPGRLVAASVQWQKLNMQQAAVVRTLPKIKSVVVNSNKSAPTEVSLEDAPAVAAVQEELSLNLVEVVNPKKYQQGLASTHFSGTLSTNNGVIESLNVSLPNDEGVAVSFSEMAGNVFEYDLNGEVYSGMMYQVDQGSYMITMTNGPLEGTRMKFAAPQPEINDQPIQAQESVAEVAPVQVGNFGQDMVMPEVQSESIAENSSNVDQQIQAETIQAQSFNMDQQAM